MPRQSNTRKPGETVSLRLSPESRKQLDELMRRWGDSQTDAIKRAIERAWGAEKGGDRVLEKNPRRS